MDDYRLCICSLPRLISQNSFLLILMTHFRPDVSVVIVSWNTKGLLRSCLKTVFEQTKEVSLEVFVVDNNSPDNSASMVAEEFPQVKLIANPDNKGFAAANNQALEVCTGSYILLLNPDTEIVDGAIDKLTAYYKQHQAEKLGVLVCKLLNDDGTLQKSVNKFYNFWRSFLDNRFMYNVLSQFSASTRMLTSHWEHDESRAIDWAYGAVMFYSREIHDKVGTLDARFFIYAEEMDYFMRVSKAGFTNWFIPEVRIIHYGKSSSRQRRAAMFIQNYKSFYLFLKKHYSFLDLAAYRLRAQIYLFLWYIKFSFGSTEEDKQQKEVYWQTIRWHFSKDSFSN